jgi:methionine synthase II (cobalamin-independent)
VPDNPNESHPPLLPPPSLPWGHGAATGIGSLPGDRPDEAARLVADQLGAFPHLPELPGAGVGADMIGRGAAHLVDLHVQVEPSGWRFAAHAGSDERRARSFLARDIDEFEEQISGHSGPVKIQVAGPWTLAASIELHYGDKALADPGAVKDLTGALGEGVNQLIVDLRRRLPASTVVVQIDEPSLPQVLAGQVPTASGFGNLRVVDPLVAVERLTSVVNEVVAAGGVPIAHCCAADPPFQVFADAGFRAISFDVTAFNVPGGTPSARADEPIGLAVENGIALFLGLIPSVDVDPMPRHAELAAPARRLWSRLGFAPELLGQRNVVTPSCGLAGASPSWPKVAYRACVEVATALLESPEETG